MRAALTGILLSVLATTAGEAAGLGYADFMRQARDAFADEDWAALNDSLDAAQALRPYSLYVWKNRILARQLAGRTEEALALVDKIAARGLSLKLSGREAFETLTAAPAFAPIAARMQANLAPVGVAQTIVATNQTGLLPEAIASVRDAIFIGSVRTGKILEVDQRGDIRGVAFAPGGVFDLELRGARAWAAVNNQLAYENANADNPFSAVMLFNLKTGAVVRDIRIAEPDALLGDIEVSRKGDVYASDSSTPRIFKVAAGQKTATVFSADPRFVNLQGIALDEDRNRLFVADYLTGLYSIDLVTGAAMVISNTADAHLGGIDGLYLYKGGLIGVQNGTTPQRIIRIVLDDTARAAVRVDVIQQNLEGWNEPTHGYVDGDSFRYIATSNWPSYDETWKERKDRPPLPLAVMVAPLEE